MQFPGTVGMTTGRAGFRARGENAAVARSDNLAASIDDIPGDTTSAATLAVGGAVTGSIDFGSDSDWYRVEIEATGGLTLEVVREYAETGVDYLSVGALTHSSPIVDIALDLDPEEPTRPPA